MHGYPAWEGKIARSVIDEKKAMPGALPPILRAIQETSGYIDFEAESLIADGLNFSRAEACRSVGGNHLCDRATERRGIGFGETTPTVASLCSRPAVAWARARRTLSPGSTRRRRLQTICAVFGSRDTQDDHRASVQRGARWVSVKRCSCA